MYASLFALLKGLILDKSLLGRAIIPDAACHQLSAQFGFKNENIFNNATKVLQAVKVALDDDRDANLLMPLFVLLEKRKTPAHKLTQLFKHSGSIEETLRHTYTWISHK